MPVINITGALTSNLNLVLPAYKKQWSVINNTTGAFSITVKTSAGSGVIVPPAASLGIVGDGTNILGVNGAVQATETVAGIAKVATAAVAVAGSNDTDMMTALKTKQSMPLTVASGAATLKLPSGYIQQVFDITESTSASDYKFFPVAFPTECLGVFAVLLSTTGTGYASNFGIVVGDITNARFLIAAGTGFSAEGRFRIMAIGR